MGDAMRRSTGRDLASAICRDDGTAAVSPSLSVFCELLCSLSDGCGCRCNGTRPLLVPCLWLGRSRMFDLAIGESDWSSLTFATRPRPVGVPCVPVAALLCGSGCVMRGRRVVLAGAAAAASCAVRPARSESLAAETTPRSSDRSTKGPHAGNRGSKAYNTHTHTHTRARAV